MRIGRVLAQFVRGDRLFGNVDLALDLSTSGRTRRALTEALDGSLVVFVSQGRVDSMWANALVKDATRALFSSTWKQGNQPFECLASSLSADDGVIPAAVLLLNAEQTRIVGRGSVDLRRRTLDLELKPHPRYPGVLSLAARVRLKGNLSDPSVSVVPLSVSASAGQALFHNAFRLSGASTVAASTRRRRKEPGPCDDLRGALARARAGSEGVRVDQAVGEVPLGRASGPAEGIELERAAPDD